ncbi:homocysteine S-methyltransferase family protein [bacterium]|nr:homocysteine S-methyltransferase family protein [bacterium]
MNSALNEIIEKRILFFDGATGTGLLSGSDYAGCPDLISLTDPESVETLHEEYLTAGCDVIETNSFCSNFLTFESLGIRASAFECAKRSAILAKKAAEKFSTTQKPRFAAGSLGPVFNKNTLETDEQLLNEAFFSQISALAEGGADLLIFETMQDIVQLNSSLASARKVMRKINKNIPLIVSISGKNGKTHTGTPFEEIVTEMSKHDLFAFGLNCEDFETMEKDAGIIKKISDFPLLLMPNLGLPENTGGKSVYKTTPEDFAEKMSEFIRKFNPKIVGGCCGTTPEHIEAMIKKYNPDNLAQ